MVKVSDNLSIVKPSWIVPSNVHAIQTIRDSVPKKNQQYTSKILVENEIGLKFLRKNLKGLNQVHSNISVKLPSDEQDADASYSFNKGIVCSVRTADCMPLLMTDDEGSFVSAIHAGWRGLSSGIIENTVKKINAKGNFIVWIGPHISQKYFEVSAEVKNIFLKNDPSTEPAFDEVVNDKYLLSMQNVAKIKLHKFGIKNINCMVNFCTYDNPKLFYSFRRGDLKERMTSLIWIE